MLRTFVFAISAIGIAASASRAQLATIQFHGRVTSIEDPGSLMTAFKVGEAVHGSFTVDVNPDDFDFDPDPAFRASATQIPPGAYLLTIGSTTFKAPADLGGQPGSGAAIETFVWNLDEEEGDGILLETYVGTIPPPESSCWDTTGITLWDYGGTALSSDNVPSTLDRTDWDEAEGILLLCGDPGFHSVLRFEILSFNTDPVPAIGAWGLGIMALLLVTLNAVVSRRRARA